MANKNRISDQQIIDALAVSGGDVTAASLALHCERATIYARIQKTPALQEALEEEREKALDIAESVLMKLIKQEKMEAVKFFLSTKGRKRGFTEKQEIDVNANVGVKVVLGEDADAGL